MKSHSFTLGAVVGGFLALTLFSSASIAHATGAGLDVIFAPNPLFSQLQFAPGATATSTISVTNNYSPTDTEQVYVQAGNINSSTLASMLTLTIQSGSTVLYRDSLAHFFSASRIPLSSIAPGATVVYDASVTFSPGASNTYQGKSVGFDVCVGIADGDVQCDASATVPTVPTVPPGTPLVSFSAAGAIAPMLTVFDESGAPSSDTAGVVTWRTNLPSTSYVVYGARSGGPYTLSTVGPLFGYPQKSTEDTSLTTTHSVVISGLASGTTYDFRVVSKLSPSGVPTVGHEYQLALPSGLAAVELTPEASGQDKRELSTQNTVVPGTVGLSASPSDEEANASNTTQTVGDATPSAGNQLAAAAALAGPFVWLKSPCVWFFVLFCALAVFAEFLYERVRRGVAYEAPRSRKVRRSIFYVVASVVGAAASLTFGRWCDLVPFAILLIVFAGYGFYLKHRT